MKERGKGRKKYVVCSKMCAQLITHKTHRDILQSIFDRETISPVGTTALTRTNYYT